MGKCDSSLACCRLAAVCGVPLNMPLALLLLLLGRLGVRAAPRPGEAPKAPEDRPSGPFWRSCTTHSTPVTEPQRSKSYVRACVMS